LSIADHFLAASPPAAHTPTPASAASAATPINTAWMSGDDAAAASRARIKSMMENALNTIVSLKDSETDTVNACKHLLEEAGKRDAALDGLRTEINEVLSTIAQQEAASKHSQTKVPETPNPAQLLGGWKPVKTIFK
jgi:hypothetical protein